MNHCTSLWRKVWLILSLLLIIPPSFAFGADSRAAIIVRESGAYLYSRQYIESDRIATLQKGDTLIPLAEAVGTATWYMVRTQQGLFGWVRAADVDVSDQFKEAIRKEEVSTWTARSGRGRMYEGTWTVGADATATSASGTWTLRDDTGTTVLRGTWSAEKFSTGWNGVWRATADDRQTEYTGSWSADFPHTRGVRFSELFEGAARAMIRGVWTGGAQSGSWSIRAVK